MENLLAEYFVAFAAGPLFVFPLWKTHAKAGLPPALSLFIFLPYMGLLIDTLILAFSRWPATAAGGGKYLQGGWK